MTPRRFPRKRAAGTLALALTAAVLACRDVTEPTALADRISGVGAPAVAAAQLQFIGGVGGTAYAVNDRGEVVGKTCTGGCFSRAFYWTESGGLQDLGTLPGYTRSVAYAITDHGAVFGKLECWVSDVPCDSVYRNTPARWDRVAGTWTITPVQGCAALNDQFVVNNNEQCVGRPAGSSQLAVQTLSGGAVVNTQPLPKLDPGGVESAYAISDVPMVAGQSSTSGVADAVVWYRDLAGAWRVLKLGLPGTDNIGGALDISEPDGTGRVRVSGRSAGAGGRGYRAVRWTLDPDGQGGWRVASTEVLAAVSKGRNTDAWGRAINTAGDVVGHFGFLPARWPIGGGAETLPVPKGDASGRALELNDNGLIVGVAWDPGSRCDRAAIWRLQ